METNISHRRVSFATSLGLAATVAMVLACLALGVVVQAGRLPSFYTPLWFAPKQAIIFYSGDICPRNAWRAACDMGLKERVFRIIYWRPEQSQIIMSVRQGQR